MRIVFYLLAAIAFITTVWLFIFVMPPEPIMWSAGQPFPALLPHSTYGWLRVVIISSGMFGAAFFLTWGITHYPKTTIIDKSIYCNCCGQRIKQ